MHDPDGPPHGGPFWQLTDYLTELEFQGKLMVYGDLTEKGYNMRKLGLLIMTLTIAICFSVCPVFAAEPDDPGTAAAPITVDPGAVDFANVKVVKANAAEATTFTYSVTEIDSTGADMGTYSQSGVAVTFAAGVATTQKIPFAAITYTAAGIHYYSIEQTAEPAWKVSVNPLTVMVNVTEADGVLKAAVTPTTFSNEYAGETKTGVIKRNGKYYYVDPTTHVIRTTKGIITWNSKMYYIKNGGEIATDKRVTYEGDKYHCGSNGVIKTGIHKWNGHYFHSFNNGKLRVAKGVFKFNGKRYYANDGGKLATSKSVTWNGNTYHCGANAVIKTGIHKWDGYYYATATGKVRVKQGLFKVGNKQYYTNKGGKFAVNKVVTWKSAKYALGSDGAVLKGINKVGGSYYYSDSKGKVRTTAGMFKAGGYYYYCNSNGKLRVSGFYYKDKSHIYYFGSNARLVKSAFTYGGVRLKPNSSGCIPYTSYKLAVSGYGDKYSKLAMVDLSEQVLYYYENDVYKFKFNVVTGSPSTPTPTGAYTVREKKTNTTVKEGKMGEVEVAYWISFKNATYGLHDATWRSEFGGTIYKTNGTPGCINCKKTMAKKLYNAISKGSGFVVIS